MTQTAQERIKAAMDSVKTDHGGGSYSFDMLAAAEAMKAEEDKLREENADRIAELDAALTRLADERKQVKEGDLFRSAQVKHKAAGNDNYFIPKQAAVEVGLNKTMLTAKGQLSKAKLKAVAAKKGTEAAQAVLDLYNNEYIPLVNRLMKEAATAAQPITGDERQAVATYNALTAQYNAVLDEKRFLLGR